MKHSLKLSAAVFLALVILLSYAPVTNALSCAAPEESPAQDIDASEYVFTGTVTNGKQTAKKDFVDPSVIHVNEVFKGKIANTVNVKLSTGWDAFSLEENKRYLFLFDKTEYNEQRATFSREACEYRIPIAATGDDYQAYIDAIDGHSETKKYIQLALVTAALLLVTSAVFTRKKTKSKR